VEKRPSRLASITDIVADFLASHRSGEYVIGGLRRRYIPIRIAILCYEEKRCSGTAIEVAEGIAATTALAIQADDNLFSPHLITDYCCSS